jgi:hypothetical protein
VTYQHVASSPTHAYCGQELETALPFALVRVTHACVACMHRYRKAIGRTRKARERERVSAQELKHVMEVGYGNKETRRDDDRRENLEGRD